MNQEEIYWVQKEGSTMENKKKVLFVAHVDSHIQAFHIPVFDRRGHSGLLQMFLGPYIIAGIFYSYF